MTKQEKKIINLARRWWRNKRPLDWNRKQHLENPGINCCSTATEKQLAIAVGEYETNKNRR